MKTAIAWIVSLSWALFWGLPALGAVEPPRPPAVVFAGIVKSQELFDRLSYPARVTPKVSTTILAETDGIVSRILAPLGAHVRRGQIIMKITHTDPVYQYAPTPVFAPVSGVMSSVDITEGTQVAQGQKLALVTDPSRVRVTIEVPAMDLSLLHEGMEGSFSLSNGENPVAIRIKGISPFVDPATGTATCELELADRKATPASSGLTQGMIGLAAFKVNDRKGISIPEDAVFYKGVDPFVRVVVPVAGTSEMRAEQIPVVLGARSRGMVEILKGLTDGAKLVERTSRYISDSETVTVQEANGT